MKASLRLLFLFATGWVSFHTPRDLRAENWGHWRGPFFNGSTTETNLPATWSTTENVAWTASVPGISGSTPVVWGDRIFVSCPDANRNLVLVCYDRADGKELWRKTVSEGDRDNGRNNMASASPVTDGKSVFVLFGTGDLAAFDLHGNPLWSRNLSKDYGRFSIQWLYGSSPLLFDGKIYVEVLQRASESADGKSDHESYLLCLDASNGKNIWRHIRPTEAHGESQEAYSSPIPDVTRPDSPKILMVGGDIVTANDAETGDEIWRYGGLNSQDRSDWRIVPSPVLVPPSLVIACAPKREPVFAFKDVPSKNMQVSTNASWKFTEFPTDCATPLYYANKLFVLDGDRKMMTCLDPNSGAKKWQGNLGVPEIFRSSPTGADGKIYCISEKGTVVVLSAGDEFKILATIPMGGEKVRSSVIASGGQLLIRTGGKLYCVGKKTDGKL